jgi:phage gp36-like protein
MAAPILKVTTREKVIAHLGGEKHVAQIIPDGNGDINYTLLDQAIEYASGEVAAHCANSWRIWTKQPDNFPQYVVQLATLLAVYWVWHFGTQGKAVPEPIRQEYTATLTKLEKIAEARTGLGADPEPPARRGNPLIDMSCHRTRAAYPTWDGAGPLGRR